MSLFIQRTVIWESTRYEIKHLTWQMNSVFPCQGEVSYTSAINACGNGPRSWKPWRLWVLGCMRADLKHWNGTTKWMYVWIDELAQMNLWLGRMDQAKSRHEPQCCKVRNGHKLFISLDWCKAPGASEKKLEDFPLLTQHVANCQDCFIACEPQCCHQRMPKRQWIGGPMGRDSGWVWPSALHAGLAWEEALSLLVTYSDFFF